MSTIFQVFLATIIGTFVGAAILIAVAHFFDHRKPDTPTSVEIQWSAQLAHNERVEDRLDLYVHHMERCAVALERLTQLHERSIP